MHSALMIANRCRRFHDLPAKAFVNSKFGSGRADQTRNARRGRTIWRKAGTGLHCYTAAPNNHTNYHHVCTAID